jgi:hypothetical protein
MKHTTPFLPAFGPLLFGRRPKSEQAKALEKLKSTNTLGDLKAVCTDSIPDELLSPAAKGDLSRRRQYSLPVLFWAFLAQILTPNTSCREIVRRVQAWRASADSETDSSHKTVAYCKARAKIPEKTLAKISKHIADRCERNTPEDALWKGSHVKIIDGTTISMPDTPLNQKDYPQPSSQKPGCGFPLMRLVGLFSLASGALLGNGAVTTYMNADGDFHTVNGTTVNTIQYFNSKNATAYTDHAVTIIGWNDTYSMTDPKTSATSTGAWLVQNSWGTTNWNNSDGTFWASYNDAVIGRSGVASFTLVDTPPTPPPSSKTNSDP